MQTPDDANGGEAEGETSGESAPSVEAEDPIEEIAVALCGALFRCCDSADLEVYTGAMAHSESLLEFAQALPPENEADCVATFTDAYTITPMGDWFDAVDQGLVSLNQEAYAQCLSALNNAACGDEVSAALWDSTCFAFSAPSGGSEQRSTFQRTGSTGDPCMPIRDGVGAGFYGSCDPQVAFCCTVDPDAPELGCTYPFDADGNPRSGTCQAVADDGEGCSFVPPLAFCRTGSSCSLDDVCVAGSTAILQPGEICAENYTSLGTCLDGWCDFLGSNVCEPTRELGAACFAGYECASGTCTDGLCAVADFCEEPDGETLTDNDEPEPEPGDEPGAGEGAGDSDSEDEAAASQGAPGEKCEDAPTLLSASSQSMAGPFTHTTRSTFGASNDYNPYVDAEPPRPPACSFVYDAAGKEVVYRVALEPGQTLSLEFESWPKEIAPAVYLLDGCGDNPQVLDGDMSGACGSNEYAVGSCSLGTCDPLTWSWTFPTVVGSEPTLAHDFFLVVDALGEATEFELNWSIQ
jgi:hypothetical protein